MNLQRLTGITALQRPGAVAIYAGLVVASLIITVLAWSAVSERRATIAAEESMLAQLEGRSPLARKDDGASFDSAPSGSPFLEGKTVNVAGAALLQRVATAINRIGGSVLSSQVDLDKADAKDGWIGLTVSCEIEQPALQKLLYDIEAGMPFLFIDQLVVDAPATAVPNSRMKVLLSVSGQWLGDK